jgi:DNA (cytosine-5)-methyltransferase 1
MTDPAFDTETALKLAAALVPGRYGVPLRRGPRLAIPAHPDAPNLTDLAAIRRWVRSAPRPTAIDLFAGAGGLSLGLRDAGFTVLAGADSDEIAAETHHGNVGGLSYVGDLSEPDEFIGRLRAWGIATVDLVAGGVPCQPFSRAGRSKIRSLVEAQARSAMDSRVDLWRSFIRIVEVVQPRSVLLENVPDLAQWNDGAVLVGFRESLRSLGYETHARILHAYQHGVPQHRSRLFIVALRPGSQFDWPSPHADSTPTLRDAIGDLPEVGAGQREERLPYDGPQSHLQVRLRRRVTPADASFVYDHITREVRPDDARAFDLLPEGATYKDVPEDLRRYRSDIFTDKYKRLAWGELSRTITAHIAKDGYWYIHPGQSRTLSVREAARIQTFPDWFRFAGEPSHRYRQIGNAVPPLLAEDVGRSLVAALARKRVRRSRTRPIFRTDLLEWHKTNSRNYPWRSGSDPWPVLFAEMCLHRARADQVANAFNDLLELAPTPTAMVANIARVRHVMTTFGLDTRADTIIRVAEALVNDHAGAVPDTLEQLQSLPGVGDYVANAVICFGYDRPATLMDSNTERITSRVLRYEGSGRRWQLRLDLYTLAGPAGANAAFNYALLDLGALVCRPVQPACLACPVNMSCATFRADQA